MTLLADTVPWWNDLTVACISVAGSLLLVWAALKVGWADGLLQERIATAGERQATAVEGQLEATLREEKERRRVAADLIKNELSQELRFLEEIHAGTRKNFGNWQPRHTDWDSHRSELRLSATGLQPIDDAYRAFDELSKNVRTQQSVGIGSDLTTKTITAGKTALTALDTILADQS